MFSRKIEQQKLYLKKRKGIISKEGKLNTNDKTHPRNQLIA